MASNENLKSGTEILHTHLPVKKEWLTRVQEEIIDPDLPIIDAHHHIWDWPDGRYMFDELLHDTRAGHNVRATVFIQCRSMYRIAGPEEMRPVGETEFINGLAAQSASGMYGPTQLCAAIVGFIDLTLGDRSEPVLEAHIRAGGGRFRGIRGRTVWHEGDKIPISPPQTPKGVLQNPATRATLKVMNKLGLSLDVWIFHTQIHEILDVARAFPELPIIVNHLACPVGIGPYEGKQDEVLAQWKKDVVSLVSAPNVYIKLGGMTMLYSGWDFHRRELPPTSDQLAAAYHPYVDHCIQAFGPSRCMFESNFPVDKAMCSYPVLWNAFKKLSRAYDRQERIALLAGTAGKVYQISEYAQT